MTTHPGPALFQALALFRTPRSTRPGPDERLPDGMELLIRLVSGDAQASALAMKGTGETAAAVRDAAAFYIQQVMFATGSDSYRVLGLDPDASDEQLKSHYRWLTRWLHPDRNPDEWEAVYSERVNRAWNDLRNSERRLRYDQNRPGFRAPGPVQARGSRPVMARPVLHDEVGPGPSLRWLPRAIFGSLGLIAVATVALFSVLHLTNPSPETEASAETDASPSMASSALADLARFQSSVPASTKAATGELPASEPVEPQPRVDASPTPPPAAQPQPPVLVAPRELPLPAVSPAPKDPTLVRNNPPPSAPAETHTPSLPREASNPGQKRVAEESPSPVPAADAGGPQEAAPEATISQREANRLVGRFSEVYAQGDLSGMRAMFTADARSPDGGLQDILDEYDQLFERSHQRVLAVKDVRLIANGDSVTIVAHYEATLKTGLFGRTRSLGDLRLDLRRENDQWLIYRLQHRDRSG